MKKILNLVLVIVIFFGCNADNTTQPEKDTTPPTVSITSPANNGSVLDSTLIVVNASDNIAVEKVEIYIDGNLVCTRSTVPWQYEWNVRNLSLNTVHTIVAKAYDAANNVGTSQTINVTVNWTDTTPPSVSITSPTNNSNVTDSTLIVVNASDNVGIKKVEFYIDGSLSRTISTVPWKYNWDVRGLSPNSTHTILAKAYDTANNIGNSGTITVTVHISPPTNGLVAYYPFNGSANDESGNGYNGTVNGATLTTDRFGNSNKAYAFNGTSSWIGGNADQYPTNERTVSLWFLANDFSVGRMLFSYATGVCGTSWIQLINNQDGGQNSYEIQSDCRINRLLSQYANPPLGRWHHWCITTSAMGTKMYIDGMLIASNSIYVNNTNVSGNYFFIGVHGGTGLVPETDTNATYFYGSLDDIRIYNRALSDPEINLLYHESGW